MADVGSQRLYSSAAQLSRRDTQITKLIGIVHCKVATNRVMQIALKAAYKILPSLEEQLTCSRILNMAKKAPNIRINQEASNILKEVGLVVNWDKQSLKSPIQTLENKSIQTINKQSDIETNQESQKHPTFYLADTVFFELRANLFVEIGANESHWVLFCWSRLGASESVEIAPRFVKLASAPKDREGAAIVR
ncbi:hypothetical protein NW768_005865 [Fusarium equiseti]|uniref:Uncharacterized protein n=1 Tax=Fusarium equiseti TaxID=61235 RepID=A0ABQ8RDQ2_FUSEQ|nr:hypothetical protein NW768_005865 [Fusarium equiseti]